jgi:ATP-dependent Clp protease ATP-binding subunit ClpA
VIEQVVTKFVLQLEAQLTDRNVTFELTDAAVKWLARFGYDAHYGARPLARVIQDQIKKPLAEELLFGKLIKGGVVKVLVDPSETKLAFEIIELKDPPSKGKGEPDETREPELAG